MSVVTHRPPQPGGSAQPGFKVRAARRGDAEALSSLLAELGYPNAADHQTVHWVLSHPEVEVLVAGDAMDKPVGMLTFSHHPQLRLKGRVLTIDELVVSAAWRRRGVGTALVKKALERARVLSAKRIELSTHAGQGPEAEAFLAAMGFQTKGLQLLLYPVS